MENGMIKSNKNSKSPLYGWVELLILGAIVFEKQEA